MQQSSILIVYAFLIYFYSKFENNKVLKKTITIKDYQQKSILSMLLLLAYLSLSNLKVKIIQHKLRSKNKLLKRLLTRDKQNKERNIKYIEKVYNYCEVNQKMHKNYYKSLRQKVNYSINTNKTN